MPLHLYRRHYRQRGKCAGGHAPDSRTYEPEELRRNHKKCHCPIYADGTLRGRFKRKNTHRWDWPEAKLVAAEWEEAGRWGDAPTPEPILVPPPVLERGAQSLVTIQRAIAAFLAEHETSSAPNTVKRYTLLLRQLKAWTDHKGYGMIDQLRPIDIREFRQSWTVSPLTASKQLGFLRAFFEYALVNEWIVRNPARLVKLPRGQASGQRNRERLPFSDDELRRMYEACRTRYGKEAAYRYSWSGEDLEDFISVSVYTGLRISDVCTFQIERLLTTGECHVRTTKNGRKVFTWVPEWLQERMRERARRYGPLIFGSHQTTDINVVTDVWRRKLKRLWKLSGPWKESPTPHRFRHTFARILLEKSGVTVRDVAELLGDTEDMVRRHYAAWVPERQERLTAILRDAFSEKPSPRIVAIR